MCGTHTRGVSDWDFVLVLQDGSDIPFERAVANVDTNNYQRSEFIAAIQNHEMGALMCLFLPPHNVWKMEEAFSSFFVLDLGM